MPREALKPGEWGNLHFKRVEDGRLLLHARGCDMQGERHRFRILGLDESECIRKLERFSGVRVTPKRAIPDDRPDLLTDTSLVVELLDCWLAMERASKRMNEATADATAAHIRNHIEAPLGRKRLNELRVQPLDRLLLRELRNTSHASARRTRSILVRALNLAERYDLIAMNYARRTCPVRLPQSEPIAMSMGDVQVFRSELEEWASARPDHGNPRRAQLRDLIEVALGTGLRLGELLALRPSAIDLDARKLLVAATCTYSRSRGLHIAETLKRSRQQRILRLPSSAVVSLQRALETHPGGDAPIFGRGDGGLLRPDNVRLELRRFVATMSLDGVLESVDAGDVSFRLFRSTVATHVARSGGIEAARDQLGHAHTSTTERSYVQRAPEVNVRIGDMLESIFGPTPEIS